MFIMKKIVRLSESDLRRIVRKTLVEMDIDMEVDDEDVEVGMTDENRQEFIDYVCGFKKEWCSKTKRFFSEMV